MAKLGSKKPIVTATDNGATLNLVDGGDYTLEFLENGKVKFLLDGERATLLSASEWTKASRLNLADADARISLTADQLTGRSITGDGYLDISGIAFTGADQSALDAQYRGNFEPSHNLNDVIGSLFAENGVAYTMAHLTINGGAADAFRAAWDYLDDAYVAGNNYYNLPLNESFARLGIAYAQYLDAGGAPLLDTVAKYAENASGAVTRLQSMHDNLLGNITKAAIDGRNFPADVKADLLAQIPDAYETRGVFSGEAAARGGAHHDSARAFDYDRGWERSDYLDRSYNAVIDPLASRDANGDGRDDSMYYGAGNPIDDWNVVRHEGAGVELGLKIKHRGGDEYAEGNIDADGVAHYYVNSGTQPGTTNRAEWNYDFAATVLPTGQDDSFTFKVEVDFDPTSGIDMREVFSFAPGTQIAQDSSNYAFLRTLIDADPATTEIEPYDFGAAEFNIRLSAYEGDRLVASNEVVVHVVEPVDALVPTDLLIA